MTTCRFLGRVEASAFLAASTSRANLARNCSSSAYSGHTSLTATFRSPGVTPTKTRPTYHRPTIAVRGRDGRFRTIPSPRESRGRAQPEHAASTGRLTPGRGVGECRREPGHVRFRPREREVGRVDEARNLVSGRLVCPPEASKSGTLFVTRTRPSVSATWKISRSDRARRKGSVTTARQSMPQAARSVAIAGENISSRSNASGTFPGTTLTVPAVPVAVPMPPVPVRPRHVPYAGSRRPPPGSRSSRPKPRV